MREFIHDVCARPEMYVGKRDFALLAALIDGYQIALCEMGKGEEATSRRWFRYWLSECMDRTHEMARNLVWQSYIVALYPQDDDAFRGLPDLYDEFLKWDRVITDESLPPPN